MPQFTPPLTARDIDCAFPSRFASIVPIDAGGQGSVFRCTNGAATLAVKIYVPDAATHIEERTAREVKALQRLDCPTIVRLVEHGQVPIRRQMCRFVTTAFIDGETAAARLQSTGPMPLSEAASLACDVGKAIEAMWQTPERIVHRDIKPPNIMLGASGRAVLIDLGIARHTSLESLTLTGAAWGTLGYMSPEQAAGRKRLSCKSDVFALGVVLVTCLSGSHPTGGDQRRLSSLPPLARHLIPGLHAEVGAFLDAMLNRWAVSRPLPDAVCRFFCRHVNGTQR
jgi:eukaryotic-like serine/threonine-protein kinase